MLLTVVILSVCPADENNIPIILVHGFSSDETTFNAMISRIQQDFPNRQVFAAKIMFHKFSSIFTGFPRYIRGAATAIRIAADGAECIDLIGHSQGALVSRAYTQLYSGDYDNYYPEVRKLVSLSGVQGGFFCDKQNYKFKNKFVNAFIPLFKIPYIAYSDFAQHRITMAGVWRDPYHFKDLYQKQCGILAQINGECTDQNQPTGKERFIKLTKFYTFYSNIDEIVLPPTAGNFAMYEPETGNYLDIMNNPIFLNDNFGLKTLYDAGKWKTCRVDILHGEFIQQEDFYNNYIKMVLQGDDGFVCL
ncbi:Palmitoyl-protein_thioesterase [Hexamita inflata]|uniref:Palmitoyl-protein_thioesterase n=1 Tax=Hexamita inflata TaxID=28002 RepID=A0ABP1IKV6_9EUKA